ncbi:hypothetical protein SteCoe_27190 [Stentor coeruleus]|uniref:Glucosamine 6-phosphate N-acetyltransferase n=1 Tax=Stentor coeruleus TaxID=5963 RepID=A0A1R2BB28_9CILI|nr:hypothetical protein SteCoe_27190 [Stentor coeruleus]
MEHSLEFLGCTIRNLSEDDFRKGFNELMTVLDTEAQLDEEGFIEYCSNIRKMPDEYMHIVAEETLSGRIVASASVMIERKYLRTGGKVGHLEDLIVNPSFRKQGLGKKILDILITRAREKGCYKVIISAVHDSSEYFEKNGFKKKGLNMKILLTQ